MACLMSSPRKNCVIRGQVYCSICDQLVTAKLLGNPKTAIFATFFLDAMGLALLQNQT
jgi:hypothetical protein